MACDNKFNKLDSENYDVWSKQMKCALIISKEWKYVSGVIKRPADIPENAAKIAEWDEKDNEAFARLMLSIQDEQIKAVGELTSSKEVWDALERTFASRTYVGKINLIRDIFYTKMAENADIREFVTLYFEKIKKLNQVGLILPDELYAILLVLLLPKQFHGLKCALQTLDQLPPLLEVKRKVLNFAESEEMPNSGKSGNGITVPVGSVMFAGQSKSQGQKQKKKKKGTGGANAAPQTTKAKAASGKGKDFPFKCFRCGKAGHRIADCPASYAKGQSDGSAGCAASFAIFNVPVGEPTAMTAIKKVDPESWLLDSGATSHMTARRDLLSNYEETGGSLSLASEAKIDVAGVGTTIIKPPTGDIAVTDVLLVPELRANLLSVAKITDKGHSVKFTDVEAVVKDNNKKIVMRIPRHGDLYILSETDAGESKNQAGVVTSKSLEPTSQVWHERFGHVNLTDLDSMRKSKSVGGLEWGDALTSAPCRVCAAGKKTVAPFPKNQHEKADGVLDLIHTDLCGPMREKTFSGKLYYMTFIDDCSRWCEVYLLNNKSDALEAFLDFKRKAENLTGRRIKALQSDGGGEYINHAFDQALSEAGIQRRTSVPYTPQQNGVAERKNRTITEMVRCMLVQSGLGRRYWGEAVMTANHIRNRCVSRSINGKTPYEIWHGKIPSVTHFRRFGERAMVMVKRPGRDKLDPKAVEAIFVGYSSTSKAWRFLEVGKETSVESRDVTFLEQLDEKPIPVDVDVLAPTTPIEQPKKKKTETIQFSDLMGTQRVPPTTQLPDVPTAQPKTPGKPVVENRSVEREEDTDESRFCPLEELSIAPKSSPLPLAKRQLRTRQPKKKVESKKKASKEVPIDPLLGFTHRSN
jgi:transposase InsO family protein